MCLIIVAWEAHPDYPLIVAANRDEFFDRPTAPAGFWEDAPHLLAGRDLKENGTWLGITRGGRIAALTNFRAPGRERKDAHSRGRLVSGFLLENGTIDDYLRYLVTRGGEYNGFNLIFGGMEGICWFSNRHSPPRFLQRGVHGLSNRILDTPWPKVGRGKEGMARLLARGGRVEADDLFAILADRTVPADDQLPDTGVGIELERLLSPVFISSPAYGTRSSTVIIVDRAGRVEFIERSFNGSPRPTTVDWRFRIGEGP